MEDLAAVLALLGFVGTPIAAWVVVKVAIAKGKVEIENLKKENRSERDLTDKQIAAIELNYQRSLDKLELDLKERIDKAEEAQKAHERAVDRNFEILFKKLEDDKAEIVRQLQDLNRVIGELKGKLARDNN